MRKCVKSAKIGDSTVDVMSAGKSLEKASTFTTFGMSRVNLCIAIIAIVLIIVLPLCRIFGRARNNSYYSAPHITGWSSGFQKWGT